MRIGLRAIRRIADADGLEHGDDAGMRRRCVDPLMRADHLGHGLADAQNGIQRRHRILEDHGDTPAAHPRPLMGRQIEE